MEENNSKEIILTQEGFDKLEDELELLKTTRRKEVAERLKEAISFGDLSENAEYDEAKKEQAALEERIMVLENMIRNAVIIDENSVDLNIVTIGSIVKIFDEEFGEEIEYTIVGSAEADPYEFKISNESPVGRALLNRKVGDKVEVNVPDGIITLEVLEIKR
ncbi:transcription elongation factor GreA [Peptostreptococcus canis]|uniref:Transcription elongation factor GreA n=1 Tax=Peptostreptococcus canis TaxID=1159213 RepID=A0ABR6TMM7_9FIRM|nr:transcription elongation factor GreA [Peptostreptococcus canis]MBC2576681.1 transcription elongation factor GreA [Peptostreptococcus canis]MBP1998470.1 transcription elongation factor GreA [Peptostreptococcus canis]